eukprot:Skav204529  [mRNA]  locus=scaffold1211:11570:12460:+ [translate_table: standard]
MEAMRSVPVERIVQHSSCDSASDCYEPAIDRRCSVKVMSSVEALASGNFHQVPVLLGVTENDGLGKSELEQIIFRPVRNRADLLELFKQDFGEKAPELLQHYWFQDESEARAVHQALSRFSNDLWYFAGTYLMAEFIAKQSCPVFLYCFAGGKSMHGSDIAAWRGASKTKLSKIMSRYLGNFSRYGNPNGPGQLETDNSAELPMWKPMAEAPDEWMFLNNEPAMKEMDPVAVRWYKFLATEYFSKRILQNVNASSQSDAQASKRTCREKSPQSCCPCSSGHVLFSELNYRTSQQLQ